MDQNAYRQFLELERTHWWFRGRRSVYLGLLEHLIQRDGKAPARILDLGCGMGGFLEGLSGLGQRVYPSDISVESLVTCRQRGFANGAVSHGYALPYRDQSFDLICLFDAIEHIEDDRRAMAEIVRVLKPGGRVFLSVPAYQFLYANNDRVAQHFRRYTRPMVRALFGSAGLQVERNSHANILLFPLILPAVLGIKLLETLLRLEARSDHTNLSWPIPPFVHSLLHSLFAAELPGTRRFDWPIGHSIVASARRPG